MTTPHLSHATDYGRLYRRPDVPAEAIGDVHDAVTQGLLVPSVTNVIDVMNKPYLQTWYAKMAAQEAVEVSKSHPGLMAQRPWRAVDYLKNAATRHTEAAASLGDTVHNIVEALSLGQSPAVPDEAAGFVAGWHQFVDDFSPTFLRAEASCFGYVDGPAGELGYAGTTDFIAQINGLTVIGDYKTGRSIHTEAALQLSALAHSRFITNEDHSELSAMPAIDGGVVLHLTATGYVLYPVDIFGEPWESFSHLRRVWGFHQRNLVSRKPLFVRGAALSPGHVTFDKPAVATPEVLNGDVSAGEMPVGDIGVETAVTPAVKATSVAKSKSATVKPAASKVVGKVATVKAPKK